MMTDEQKSRVAELKAAIAGSDRAAGGAPREIRAAVLVLKEELRRAGTTARVLRRLDAAGSRSERVIGRLDAATALAAAVNGLTSRVRAPTPCRPSKLRLLVLMEYMPAATVSPFIPKHMEQPDSRQSAPAALKMSA